MALQQAMSHTVLALVALCAVCAAGSAMEGPTAAAGASFYTAAVLEFCPETAASPTVSHAEATRIMLANVATIHGYMAQAALQGAQILVAPEMAVCGFPFTDRASVLPYLIELPLGTPEAPYPPLCTESMLESEPVLYAIGCAAKQHSMTLVLDLPERIPCNASVPHCPVAVGHWQMNTQVVVSPDGNMISVYHKSHLFEGEVAWFDRPPWAPEMSFFDTPFGVRFGQFVCFDLFFRTPEVEMAEFMDIKHFTFSTDWVNTALVPLIAAAQLQQAFSRFNDVTLLAANYGTTWASSGSGIYQRGEPLAFTYNHGNDNVTKLLIAKVPIAADEVRSPPQQAPRPLATTPYAAIKANALAAVSASLLGTGTSRPVPAFANHSMAVEPFHAAQAATPTTVVASSGTLECRVTYVAEPAGAPETFAVFSWDGIGFSGLLPMRLCGVAVCPDGDCGRIGVSTTTRFTELRVESYMLPPSATSPRSPMYAVLGGADADVMPPSALNVTMGSEAAGADLADGSAAMAPVLTTASLTAPTEVTNLILYQEQPGVPPS